MWKKKIDTNKKNNSSRVNHVNNNIDPQNTPRAEPTSSYSKNSISQNNSNGKDNWVRQEKITATSEKDYKNFVKLDINSTIKSNQKRTKIVEFMQQNLNLKDTIVRIRKCKYQGNKTNGNL